MREESRRAGEQNKKSKLAEVANIIIDPISSVLLSPLYILLLSRSAAVAGASTLVRWYLRVNHDLVALVAVACEVALGSNDLGLAVHSPAGKHFSTSQQSKYE